MIRQAAIAVLVILASIQSATARATAPVHHAVEVWLDPDERYLRATVRTTVFESGAIDVRLAPWLELSALEVDGRPLANIERHPVVRVDLGGGDSHEILFEYGGVAPPAEPQLADAETIPLFIDPEGSYLPGGGGWLPSLDSRRVTYRLEMTVPERYRAIASGRLVEERVEGGRYTAVVANDHPADEPSMFAGPYAVREQWHRGIRLRTYFHDELAGLAEDYLARSAGYLDRFSDKIGDYPFADFFVIASPLPVGLGFPNLTYVGRRVLALPFMLGRSLAHEILHNWWGNGVYVDYQGGNWSEGLTTYMADYALAAERGPDAARDMRLQWLRDFATLPADRDFPVISFTAKTHDADQVIGYNKVAFIFHMLEREIGASAFTAGFRSFWKNHRFRIAGWPDLRRAFERASGRDLAGFFEQWLERAGAPRLDLINATTEQESAGQRVSITVGQDRPPYRLLVPLVVETGEGQVRAAARLNDAKTTATTEVDALPRAVSVDPGYDLFRRLDPSEMPPIFRSVTLDPKAVAIVATTDASADAVARDLAPRLLGRDVRFVPLAPPPDRGTPVLLIATQPDIERAMAVVGMEPPPQSRSGEGTARAWAGQRSGGAAIAIVAAEDGKALAAALAALPHYGRMSYLVFEGSKVIDKGVLPVSATRLIHNFNAR